MEKRIGKFLFIFLCLLYLAVRFLRWYHLIIPLVNSYLDDLLCLPIILTIILFILRRWVLHNKTYYFSIYHILFAAAYFSFVFEFYLPRNRIGFTADFWDILAYFSGGLLFYLYCFYEKRRISPENTPVP